MNSELIISHRPAMREEHFSIQNLVVKPQETLSIIISGCVLALLEFHKQRLALNELIKINTAGVKLANFLRPFLDKILKEEGKIDVRNIESLKLREHGKKGSGKKSGKGKSGQGNQEAKDKAEKRKKEEEEEKERLKNWNEDWERKLKAQEILDDVPCCSGQGLIIKPRTQSNIWIKVTKDKNIQDIEMAFMHVPVPKPKPPPLPKLVVKIVGEKSLSDVDRPKAGKKKGKGNDKKKKEKKNNKK